jgi:uncharacterized protein (DUF1501 family)
MLTRRQLLTRTLQSSSLLALGSVVPQFVANTALAAQPGKDNILVLIELNGGNDGLNTVIPYADDLYHKARTTLRKTKDQVLKVNDHIGLNPSMRSFAQMLQQGQLAIVQGVGYPNSDRSHFESMDIWQSADPTRKTATGWLGRAGSQLNTKGGIPIMNVGATKLPLAVSGPGSGAISINNRQPYRIELGGGSAERLKARRKLIEDLAQRDKSAEDESMLQFVVRRQVQTLSTLDRLTEVLRGSQDNNAVFGPNGRIMDGGKALQPKLQLVARLIQQEFGTRVFYVMRDDFDTHSGQNEPHGNLLAEIADSINNFFVTLKGSGHDKRVRVMTFSEFGRRVEENASKGTDHGSGSCLFVAGPSVKAGPIGEHPSLKNLDNGDLKHHTDFRRVYATLLDTWLGVDSQGVLNGKWEHIAELKPKA